MASDGVTLTDDQRKQIFQRDIIPTLSLHGGRTPHEPRAVIIGGQPGSGKSHHVTAARADLQATGATWVINGDDLYHFHPRHNDLIDKHGSVDALEMMKGEAGAWVKMALQEAQRRQVNIVMETTLRQPDLVVRQAEEFRKNGYLVHAKVLAVSEQESWLGNRWRYEKLNELGYPARLTPKDVHDAAVVNSVRAVELLERGRAVDRIDLIRRGGGAPMYSNVLRDGEWEAAPSAALMLSAERKKPFNSQQLESYRNKWKQVEIMAADRLSGSSATVIHAERTQMQAERKRGEGEILWRSQSASIALATPRKDAVRER